MRARILAWKRTRGRGDGRGFDVKNQDVVEDLHETVDVDVEQFWIKEAQRRYDAYLKGELEALPGEEVMNPGSQRIERGARYRVARASVIDRLFGYGKNV